MKNKRIVKIIVAAVLTVCTVVSFTGCGKKTYMDTFIEEKGGFLYGISVPWFKSETYGRDIAVSPYYPDAGTGFDEEYVREVFENCKFIGFDIVNLWLSEIMEGIMYDENGNVTGSYPDFMPNLEKIVVIAEEVGIRLSLCLVPHLSFVAKSDEDHAFRLKFVSDPETTKTYIDNFLSDVLDIAERHPIVVMIDIYAEPEGDIRGDEGNHYAERGMTWPQMQKFLRTVSDYIKKRIPKMTVMANSGWQEYGTVKSGKYDDVGLDYIGVDIYNDEGSLQPVKYLNTDIPMVVGEFGMGTKDNWTETIMAHNTQRFFDSAKEGGYKCAFLWCYGFKGSGEALTLVGEDGKLRECAYMIKEYIENAKAE